jgi:GxxExxY protein
VIKDQEDDPLSRSVIGAAIEVHRALGPGFLESVYEEARAVELEQREISFVRQQPIGVSYKGHLVGQGRIDFLVDDQLIIELKAIEALLPIHSAQLLSYLKTTRCPVGLLINFNVPMLIKGVKRLVLS